MKNKKLWQIFPFNLFFSSQEKSSKELSSRDHIIKEVKRLYGTQTNEVMHELDRYKGSVVADRDRVQSAILKLHNGTFENLKRWVQVALYDYRDVLGPAEYPEATTAEEVDRFNNWKLNDSTVKEITFAGIVENIEKQEKKCTRAKMKFQRNGSSCKLRRNRQVNFV